MKNSNREQQTYSVYENLKDSKLEGHQILSDLQESPVSSVKDPSELSMFTDHKFTLRYVDEDKRVYATSNSGSTAARIVLE